MIDRALSVPVLALLNEKGITRSHTIILYGARKTGKSTLIRHWVEKVSEQGKSILLMDGRDPEAREKLKRLNRIRFVALFGNPDLIVLDHAENISGVDAILSTISNHFPKTGVLAATTTLSYQQTLSNKANEKKYYCYRLDPISWSELRKDLSYFKAIHLLEQRMIFGMYPEVLCSSGNEVSVLKKIWNDILTRDILSSPLIRRPDILEELIRVLALNTGSEMSMNYLARLTGADKNTIASYIRYLESHGIIYRIPSYSEKIPAEIRKKNSLYFTDTGIRNVIINQFNPLALRNDTEEIWRNFIINERRKYLALHGRRDMYFWRAVDRKRVDYLEVQKSVTGAWQFFWNPSHNSSRPLLFEKDYGVKISHIHNGNFTRFVDPDTLK